MNQEVIQLFPKSGIQVIEVGKFSVDDDDLNQSIQFEVDESQDMPGLYMPRKSSKKSSSESQNGDQDWGYDDDDDNWGDDGEFSDDDFTMGSDDFGADDDNAATSSNSNSKLDRITLVPREALENADGIIGFGFTDHWWPIPYSTNFPFWTQVFLKRLSGDEYQIYIKVDTHYEKGDEKCCNLQQTDLDHRQLPRPHNPNFWNSDIVINYLKNLSLYMEKEIPADNDRNRILTVHARMRALSMFLARKLPPIEVTRPKNSSSDIDVDLILDLGNCRSCAVIMETEEEESEPHFHKVPFRSRLSPDKKEMGTIDSRFVFSRGPRSVQGAPFPNWDSFQDLSIIRVGHDAINLAENANSTNSSTGMSSPKRYLWDSIRQKNNWSFIDEKTGGVQSPIEGDVLRYIPERGDPFDWPRMEQQITEEVGNPRPDAPVYARKAGLIYLVIEILKQTYDFINDHQHRCNSPIKGSLDRRRVLKNIVLTFPSCMPEKEKIELQRGARKAVRLWHRFNHDPKRFATSGVYVMGKMKPGTGRRQQAWLQPEPYVEMECDEALSIQLCFLYLELMGTWRNNAKAFFDAYAKNRGEKRTLRIASLDIGGGTSDIAIADYDLNASVGYAGIKVTPVYTYGVRVGGDDIQKAILERLILPQLNNRSSNDLSSLREQLYAPNLNDPEWLNVRRQLVASYWVPIARSVWAGSEEEESIFASPYSLGGSIGRFVEKFEEVLGVNPVDGYDVSTTNEQIIRVMEDVIGPVIEESAKIVALFDCDIMVLGGRIMGHPWVHERLQQLAPIGPDCIVPLHGYPASSELYPFADGTNRINDAKTCVVVGATYFRFASTIGGALKIYLDEKKAEDSLIGVVNPMDGIMHDQPLFFGSEKRGTFDPLFGGDIWIGEKKAKDELIVCNPLWRLKWSRIANIKLKRDGYRVVEDPRVKLTLERDEASGNPTNLKIESVKGKFRSREGEVEPIEARHLISRFQTMFEDHYWLDTGRLEVTED